jgi:hypothetical protein
MKKLPHQIQFATILIFILLPAIAFSGAAKRGEDATFGIKFGIISNGPMHFKGLGLKAKSTYRHSFGVFLDYPVARKLYIVFAADINGMKIILIGDHYRSLGRWSNALDASLGVKFNFPLTNSAYAFRPSLSNGHAL